jgi:nicotinamide riboside transporter PnuC
MMPQKTVSTGSSAPQSHQLRPTALFGVQFVLRTIGLIASLIGIAIAGFVAIKIHKTWGFVFISVSK